MTIIVIYKQPKSNKIKFVSELGKYLEEKEQDKNVIILGDMNIDILEGKNDHPEKHTIEKYLNLLAFKGYEIMINSKTRDDTRGDKLNESCLDHIFWKHQGCEGKGATILRKVADHYFTAFWMWNKTEQKVYEELDINVNKTRYNDKNITNELNNIDWSCLDALKDPNLIYFKMREIIDCIYNNNKIVMQQVYCKKNKVKQRNQWINKELIDLINYKNELWKQISNKKRDISIHKISEYRNLKNQIKKDILQCIIITI
jgi:hypothetical protein